MNPLEQPLRQLFRQLNVAYGLLLHLEYQLKNYVDAMRNKFGGLPATATDVGLYTQLIVDDLTHPSGLFRYPSGGFETEGEEYLEIAKRLVNRNAAWAVVQGWERFESFLLDTAATFLVAHPEKIEWVAQRKFLEHNPASNLDTFSDLRFFVKRMYRAEKVLVYLRKLAPDICSGERNNYRRLDLQCWYNTVAEVRHAIAHSDEVILLKAYNKMTSSGVELLTRCFPGALEPIGYRLNLPKSTAQVALETFASYGFLIFKALSATYGYEWDILKGDFAKEEARKIREAPNPVGGADG